MSSLDSDRPVSRSSADTNSPPLIPMRRWIRHTDRSMPIRVSAVRHAMTCWYTLSISVPSRSKRKEGAGDSRYDAAEAMAPVSFIPNGPGIRPRPGSPPRPGQTPPTAITPSIVPRKAWLPVIDIDEKCGSVVPRLSEALVAPVAWSSSYSVPPCQSVTQTAPPPMTGEPWRAGRAAPPHPDLVPGGVDRGQPALRARLVHDAALDRGRRRTPGTPSAWATWPPTPPR